MPEKCREGCGPAGRAGPHRRSEAQPQAEAEHALLAVFAALVGLPVDFRVSIERFDRSVGIESHVGNIRSRIRVGRGIGGVERFGTKLEFLPLRQAELAEETEIKVADVGAAQDVEARCAPLLV